METENKVIQEEQTGGVICPICYEKGCEFWVDDEQVEAFFMKGRGDFTTSDSGDDLQMGYFETDKEQAIFDQTMAIQLSDGRRAYLRHYSGVERYDMESESYFALEPQSEMAVQRMYYIDEEESHVIVELVYMPNGESPEQTLLYNEAYLEHVQLKLIVPEDNLWVRVGSPDSRVDLEKVLDVAEVNVVDVHAYDLGNSLRFYDDQNVIRIWGDRNDYGYARSLIENDEALFVINGGYIGRMFKVCHVNGLECELEIASITFEAHYEQWVEKIALAKERGHRVFPVYQLENVECNDITYQVYLQDRESAVGYDGYTLVFSPIHEKNIGVMVPLTELIVDANTIQNGERISDILSEENIENIYQVLDNIYFRNAIPN